MRHPDTIESVDAMNLKDGKQKSVSLKVVLATRPERRKSTQMPSEKTFLTSVRRPSTTNIETRANFTLFIWSPLETITNQSKSHGRMKIGEKNLWWKDKDRETVGGVGWDQRAIWGVGKKMSNELISDLPYHDFLFSTFTNVIHFHMRTFRAFYIFCIFTQTFHLFHVKCSKHSVS
jgi:hypothetical protein